MIQPSIRNTTPKATFEDVLFFSLHDCAMCRCVRLWLRGCVKFFIRHKKEVEPSSPYPPCRAWTPCNTDMEKIKPHLEVFRIYGILTKKSVLPIILILHRLCSQFVKCPSSQGQNKRNALSQYVTILSRTAQQRYTFFGDERSMWQSFLLKKVKNY